MSYPPYGQNPYGQPSGPWQGAGGQPPQQPGWGQPQQQPGWGQQPQQPAWGQPQQQPGWAGQPGTSEQPHPQPQQSGPAHPVPPTPVPEPERRKAQMIRRDVLVVTTESIPGRDVVEVLGEVLGVITRPRDMRPSPDMTAILTETRQEAISAMVEMAQDAGADAVIGLRFDGGKIADAASEITAYGTAVKLDRSPTRAAEAKDEQGTEEIPEEQPAEESNPFVSF